MDWFVTIISSLITGGVGATIGTIYTARKNSEVGMSGNEVEAAKAVTADWNSMMEYTKGVISRLDKRVEDLETRVQQQALQSYEDSLFIDLLQDHINRGLGPPAPTRPPR